MANTGNIFPGTGENLDRGGRTDWVNPGNIVSDNATDATNNAGATGSDYLVARNFNFASVPVNATITGIVVRIEASEHSTSNEVVSAQIRDASGTLVGSPKTQTVNGTTKAVYTYGTTSDVWGAAPTPAMVHDVDFGVQIWYATAQDVRIDYVTMALEYTVPAVGMATEGDQALALGRVKRFPSFIAAETDLALALSRHKLFSITYAQEVDSALALVLKKIRSIPVGRADEADLALALGRIKVISIGLAQDSEQAFALQMVKKLAIGLAQEADAALALSFSSSAPPSIGPLEALVFEQFPILPQPQAYSTWQEWGQALVDTLTVERDLESGSALVLASYGVGTMPRASRPGVMLFIPDEAGGAIPAFSDGTNWRRVSDRTIVS